MNKYKHELGYASYVLGNKIPRWASQDFVDGWWAAHDKGERFGEYETFLQAPD